MTLYEVDRALYEIDEWINRADIHAKEDDRIRALEYCKNRLKERIEDINRRLKRGEE